jgi:thiol-disulfide isomerase/thioredoxin
MHTRRFLIPAVMLTLLAACGGKGLGVEASGQAIRAATGYNVVTYEPAKRWAPKAFAGAGLSGGRITNSVVAGKVSVVNFWASWCGPCRAEQAELERLWRAYEVRGVQFLGVNIRDTMANARAHVEEFGVSYPSIFNQDSTVAYTFRVLFIPTTYVLDQRGRVAVRIVGATTEQSNLSAILDEVIAS